MGKQKFHKGDWVRVVKEMPSYMSHFQSDCEAIVVGSYTDKFGGSRENAEYTIYIKDNGESSWYEENQLILIEKDRKDLLKEWELAREADNLEKSDLDWIFEHGEEVLENGYGASIEALGKCLGMTNLSGSHGEGFVYYHNAITILSVSEKFLISKDKESFLEFCKYNQIKSVDGKIG